MPRRLVQESSITRVRLGKLVDIVWLTIRRPTARHQAALPPPPIYRVWSDTPRRGENERCFSSLEAARQEAEFIVMRNPWGVAVITARDRHISFEPIVVT